jgi:MFS transporter, DHA1 family, inner membrane transport protein
MTAGSRNSRALVALGFGAFVIGTAEFIVIGVLDLVARDLQLSISAAGYMVTAYALGISIGGPLVAAATTRMNRRTLLLWAVGISVMANVVALLPPKSLQWRYLPGCDRPVRARHTHRRDNRSVAC